MAETSDNDSGGGDAAQLMLQAVRGLLEEQGRDPSVVSLDARLDADLGLDSLTRVELLARVEQALSVRLPDRVVVEAETPRDLLHALKGAQAPAADALPGRRETTPVTETASAVVALPAEVTTLVEALEWHVATHPQRVHVHLLGDDDAVEAITYGALMEQALRIAAGLVARGVSPGDSVAIMLPTGREYLECFVAILLAGATPVPIYPPARAKQIQEHFARHARILDNAGARMLITFAQVKQVSRLLTARVSGLEHLVTVDELAGHPALALRPSVTPDQVAFLQYTSGSTGDPKGVVLTHANILASLRCMRSALGATADDVFVSWLPLYHDMGLIGAWLGALVVGFPLVLMSPLTFLARPERWLQAVHRFGGTISGGPNFAYELCTRRISDEALEGIDLSSWRLAFNGAEPVSPETMARFCERFASSGFEASAMTPVYGLAEATLGVAFTPAGRGPRVDRISRDALYARAEARADPGDDAMAVVSSGVAIPEFEVRIVDDTGREAADRREGEIEFKGPGATGGYFRNAEASGKLFNGGWVRTGDRGYLADGELYITGRDKDVVIRAGRNIYPYDLEQAVAEVEGVRRGCVAVFGSTDAESATERLVVLAETRVTDEARRGEMVQAIEALTLELLDLPADQVVLAPPHTVLKTSSGKIRRAALAERHARGALETRDRATWVQVLMLAAQSFVPTLRRGLRRLRALAYAGWFGLVLALNVLWAWPAVAFLPSARLRWRAAGIAARMVLRLAGIRLGVTGPMPGPGERGVLVVNHQSYLDGLVLVAVLPEPVAFVAKGELKNRFISRRFLDGIGVLYVQRFDRAQGVADTHAIADALACGRRVVFFPEGTFHRMPGLLPFQLGAFETVLRQGGVVQPVVLNGTRNVLRGDDLFPRRHPVDVRFLEPIEVEAVDDQQRWAAAVALRARVRAGMLAALPEPDLAARDALSELARQRTPD